MVPVTLCHPQMPQQRQHVHQFVPMMEGLQKNKKIKKKSVQ